MGQSDKFYPAGGDQLDVDLLGFLQLEPHVLLLLLQPVVLILQLFQLSELVSIFGFLRHPVVTTPTDNINDLSWQSLERHSVPVYIFLVSLILDLGWLHPDLTSPVFHPSSRRLPLRRGSIHDDILKKGVLDDSDLLQGELGGAGTPIWVIMVFQRESVIVGGQGFLCWTIERMVGVEDVEVIMLIEIVVQDQTEVEFIQVVEVLNNEGVAIGVQRVVALR